MTIAKFGALMIIVPAIGFSLFYHVVVFMGYGTPENTIWIQKGLALSTNAMLIGISILLLFD